MDNHGYFGTIMIGGDIRHDVPQLFGLGDASPPSPLWRSPWLPGKNLKALQLHRSPMPFVHTTVLVHLLSCVLFPTLKGIELCENNIVTKSTTFL